MNECVYKWILCAIFHTKVICSNGIKTSFRHTNTQIHTYAPAQQKHMSRYQIERNKVVARDKCLRANDLSLLFFRIFLHFIFSTTLSLSLSRCYCRRYLSSQRPPLVVSLAPMLKKTFSIFLFFYSVANVLCVVT